ncbi:unnamed protein product [Arctia plantaginis]|uniref:Uncharacterized protein n=1 Tax=Arctia plantaginis TaxID=874455 RepID=A0A8S1B085_ARCPL|nr:unnamed protein product [Arctia plantaginis]
MSRCLRIFGAYSFRLTRRHSTILMIASFLVALTMVLQLYAHRHHDQSQANLRMNAVYKPGGFLKNKRPENISYCYFNYGLPERLRFEKLQIYPSPESGNQSSYKVIYDAIIGTAYLNRTKSQEVTYVTHATPEFLYHLVEITRYWEGPISIAVYVPGFDLDLTMQIMHQLCHCYPGMMKVSMHLFYPKRFPPQIRTLEEKKLSQITKKPLEPLSSEAIARLINKKLGNYRKLDNSTRGQYIQWVRKTKIERMMKGFQQEMVVPNLDFKDCSGLDNYNFSTYRKVKFMMYPVNVGRNVARNASKTNYFLVSDIELIPSYGLAPKFLKMIRKLMGDEKRDAGCVFAKTVFVVPLFEVEKDVIIPHDKALLVQMVQKNLARYFHQKLCSHCQRFPGLQTWLARPARNVLEPMLISKREYPYHRWEPLYFGTNKEPWYSEMLTWEGRQDKMTQIMELCLQDYEFKILDGGFLVHGPDSPALHGSQFIPRKSVYSNSVKLYCIIMYFKEKYNDRSKSMCLLESEY